MADKTSTIKTIFALDGEAKYNDAIKSINAQQRLLRSELSLATAEFDKNGDKAGASRAKIESLTKQIELQKRKVEEARNALEQANEKWGEADERTIKYTNDLNYAEAGLLRLNRQLERSQEELAKQESKLVQAGDAAIKAGEKMQSVGDGLDKFGSSLSRNVTAPLMIGAGFAAKSAMEWETAATGIAKTIDMTNEEFEAMKLAIREMAIELPGSTEDLAQLAETAGQLGIKKENVLDFVEVMVRLGVSSKLAGEEGAAMLAQYANITQMPQDKFEEFASTIVDLGNNTATTEKDIMMMATRLAAAGSQVGMTDAEILAMSATLSSLGLESQAGGSAFSRIISQIQLEVETGGEKLAQFADIAGMSVDEFSRAFREDAADALMAFVSGLGDTERNGASAIKMLDDMEIRELRVRDALLRASNAQEMMNGTMDIANRAWAENNALRQESDRFMETSAQKLEKERDRLKDVGLTLGAELLPHLVDFTRFLADAAQRFNELDPAAQKNVLTLLAVAAAMGPVAKVSGTVVKGIGNVTEGVGQMIKAMGEKKAIESMSGAIGSGSTGLAGSLAALGPILPVVAVGIGAIASIAALAPSGVRDLDKAMQDLALGVDQKIEALNNAGSAFGHFAGGISFTGEKVAELEGQIRETQANIVEIAENAARENRELTDEERQSIEELTGLLVAYTEQKVEAYLQQQRDYATYAARERVDTDEQLAYLINGAQEAADQTVTIANSQYQRKISELNKQFYDEKTISQQEYRDQLEMAQRHRDNQVAEAENTRIATVNQLSWQYDDQNQLNKEFLRDFEKYTADLLKTDSERAAEEARLRAEGVTDFTEHNAEYRRLLLKHQGDRDTAAKNLAKLLQGENAAELESWMARIFYTQSHGGTLTKENQAVLDTILSGMSLMPGDSKRHFRNMINTMIDELIAGNPEVAGEAEKLRRHLLSQLDGEDGAYEAGQGIGAGLEAGMRSKAEEIAARARRLAEIAVERMKRTVEMASPSKVTRAIGEATGEGFALGLEDKFKRVGDAGEELAVSAYKSISELNVGVPDLPASARTRLQSFEDIALQIGSQGSPEGISYSRLGEVMYQVMSRVAKENPNILTFDQRDGERWVKGVVKV